MGDHLQHFSKKISKAPFVSAMPISTDPAFHDKLSHRKRTNVSFVNFGRNLGRDNKLYHISDGYNLNKREDETYMDQFLALQLAQKEHKYRHLQQKITSDAQENVEQARKARLKS